jgi:hypothetical protein
MFPRPVYGELVEHPASSVAAGDRGAQAALLDPLLVCRTNQERRDLGLPPPLSKTVSQEVVRSLRPNRLPPPPEVGHAVRQSLVAGIERWWRHFGS